jgi:hypothetical protein
VDERSKVKLIVTYLGLLSFFLLAFGVLVLIDVVAAPRWLGVTLSVCGFVGTVGYFDNRRTFHLP